MLDIHKADLREKILAISDYLPLEERWRVVEVNYGLVELLRYVSGLESEMSCKGCCKEINGD